MLMRTDPFRDVDRLAQQTCPPVDDKADFLAAERPRGVFSRQLILGDNLDLDRIDAGYRDGVLRLIIPVAEKAKPRKITINRDDDTNEQAITTGKDANGAHRRDNTVVNA